MQLVDILFFETRSSDLEESVADDQTLTINSHCLDAYNNPQHSTTRVISTIDVYIFPAPNTIIHVDHPLHPSHVYAQPTTTITVPVEIPPRTFLFRHHSSPTFNRMIQICKGNGIWMFGEFWVLISGELDCGSFKCNYIMQNQPWNAVLILRLRDNPMFMSIDYHKKS
jgi:hypothetical protein